YQALGDRGAADEAVQDVFTSVWRHAHTYDEHRGSFRTWVYRIARNAVIDKRRRRAVRPALSAFEESPGAGPGALDEPVEPAVLPAKLDLIEAPEEALQRPAPEIEEAILDRHARERRARRVAAEAGRPRRRPLFGGGGRLAAVLAGAVAAAAIAVVVLVGGGS